MATESQTQPTGRGRCFAHHTGTHCAVLLSPGEPEGSGIVNSPDHRSKDRLSFTKDNLGDEAKHAIISRVERLVKSGFPNEPFDRFFQLPRNQIALIGTLEYQCKGVGEDGKYLNRRPVHDHYRILLTPYGINVTKFESLRELVSVFTDYTETIYGLYKAGYHHRDICERNLIIVDDEGLDRPQQGSLASREAPQEDVVEPHGASGSCLAEPQNDGLRLPQNDGSESPEDHSMKARKSRTAYVIDFECATETMHENCASTFLTGTLPFMSIEMLRNNGVWVCSLQDGPRRKGHHPESNYQYEDSVLEGWNGGRRISEDTEGSAFKKVGTIKAGSVGIASIFKVDILDRLPVYFKRIENLLKELRKILFKESDDYGDPNIPEDDLPISERKNEHRVFGRYIDALKKARDQLPFTDEGFGTSAGAAQVRPRRIAAAKCREFLRDVAEEERLDGDDPKDKRKDKDASDVFGQLAVPLDTKGKGKGKTSAGTSGSQSRKRAAPDVTSSSKRPCTIGSRSKVKRSQR